MIFDFQNYSKNLPQKGKFPVSVLPGNYNSLKFN